MVKIVTTIIRGTEKQRDDGPVSVLENGVIAQPAAALYLVSEELEHMAEVGSKLLYCSVAASLCVLSEEKLS